METGRIFNPQSLGAIPNGGSTHFRVWAPFAHGLSVTGSFNQWNKSPLKNEGNGYWSSEIEGAKPGDEYKFVIQAGDKEFFKNDPYARQLNQKNLNSVIWDGNRFDWGQDHYQLPPLNQIVIYELHVGTFNPEENGKPGHLKEVARRLPYLKELGINVIELMPVAEFPTPLSWGYNPTNPFAVDISYGGTNALKELVKAAHEHGIGVIVDVVYNHFGPQDLDLWQFDGWNENNLGGIYFYNDWRSWTPWGENRPDYGRAEVRQYIRDNALMWLEDFHVDGLRFDAIEFIRNTHGYNNDPVDDIPEGWSLLQWVNDEAHRYFPEKITIGEDMQCNEWIVKSTGAGGCGFYTQWDAGFVHPIRMNTILPEDRDRDMNAIAGAIQFRYDEDAFKRVIYSESHDEVANGRARIPTEINPENPGDYYAQKRSTLAAGLVFTSPGIPMIFEGQEFLEDGWFRDEVPIDWKKLDAFHGINRLYRDLIHLRLNKNGKTKGLAGQNVHVFHVNHEFKICAFRRWMERGPEDETVVIANFSHVGFPQYEFGLPAPGTWKVRFNSDWKGYSEVFNDQEVIDCHTTAGQKDSFPQFGKFGVGPYSLVILSQDKTQPETKET